MNGILFTAPKTMIHNLKKCIGGLTLSQLVVNPLALGKLALSDGEQILGQSLSTAVVKVQLL